MPAPPSLPGARAPGALGSEVGPPLPALHPLLQGAAPHPVRPRQTRPPRGVSPPTCPAWRACRGARRPHPTVTSVRAHVPGVGSAIISGSTGLRPRRLVRGCELSEASRTRSLRQPLKR